ncbi:MAG: phosphate acetyltransferase [Candidatus Omnitrophica bacterium]|nr:phosphate acetyltransferase [Candidatus Omnitrophota bacterium]
MDIFKKIYQQAKVEPKNIVLPEGEDLRILQAAAYTANKKLAKIIVLGKPGIINNLAKKNKINLSKVEILQPSQDQAKEKYIETYAQLQKHRGITPGQAREFLLSNFVFYAAMMVRQGAVDGFVAGACHTTSDVARAALQCIPRLADQMTMSGSFLININDQRFGEAGLFLFADCAIVPTPTSKQLANIALSSAEVWTKITNYQARLAMLSFSTKGSSSAEPIIRVRQATELAKTAKQDLIIDGELQLDSAIVPEVAKIKAPDSPIAGRANILIFPNLDAGNIAYKLLQRLAGARVVGPLIQGLAKPGSDLSRGCGVEEITDAIVVTAVRAQ